MSQEFYHTILLQDHCCSLGRLPSGVYFTTVLMPYGQRQLFYFGSIDHAIGSLTMLVGRLSYRELMSKGR